MTSPMLWPFLINLPPLNGDFVIIYSRDSSSAPSPSSLLSPLTPEWRRAIPSEFPRVSCLSASWLPCLRPPYLDLGAMFVPSLSSCVFSLPVSPALVGLPCPNVKALFSTIRLTWVGFSIDVCICSLPACYGFGMFILQNHPCGGGAGAGEEGTGERKQLAELIVFLYKRGKNKR